MINASRAKIRGKRGRPAAATPSPGTASRSGCNKARAAGRASSAKADTALRSCEASDALARSFGASKRLSRANSWPDALPVPGRLLPTMKRTARATPVARKRAGAMQAARPNPASRGRLRPRRGVRTARPAVRRGTGMPTGRALASMSSLLVARCAFLHLQRLVYSVDPVVAAAQVEGGARVARLCVAGQQR